jgi:hypothetical protein
MRSGLARLQFVSACLLPEHAVPLAPGAPAAASGWPSLEKLPKAGNGEILTARSKCLVIIRGLTPRSRS